MVRKRYQVIYVHSLVSPGTKVRPAPCACAMMQINSVLAVVSFLHPESGSHCDVVSVMESRGCAGATPRRCRVSFTLFFAVSIAAQNKSVDSIYPIGIDRRNSTGFSSSSYLQGIRKAAEGTFYRKKQMGMYTYERSNLLL